MCMCVYCHVHGGRFAPDPISLRADEHSNRDEALNRTRTQFGYVECVAGQRRVERMGTECGCVWRAGKRCCSWKSASG